MYISLAELFLLVMVMVFVVPALTRGAVDVPNGGWIRALFAVLLIGLINKLLWVGIALATAGREILVDFITFAVVSLLVNGAAFVCTSRIAPSVLYVRSFAAAIGAALVTTLSFYAIHSALVTLFP